MKRLIVLHVLISVFISFGAAFAQSGFSVDQYENFKESIASIDVNSHLTMRKPSVDYFSSMGGFDETETAYLDSISEKFNLTPDEIELLQRNNFVVSERLSYGSFGAALDDIWGKDMPVFLSSDAVLHTLHASYDAILKQLERTILSPNLNDILTAMYDSFGRFADANDERLAENLADIDLYVTMALSLLEGDQRPLHLASQNDFDALWEAVNSERMISMPLFSKASRDIDFSQFTVCGHYTEDEGLSRYFQCMMWLGRIDFLLTPPEVDISGITEDIPRMTIDAVLMNEFIDYVDVRSLLDENGEIIDFMVGLSDNLTPAELSDVAGDMNITSEMLLEEEVREAFTERLKNTPEAEQRILSNFLIVSPDTDKPDDLPISFRLMGQRFVIDSYIFSNLVYDKIIVDNAKVPRMMPDPLDIAFVLGNDDALPLLEEELERYRYSAQLEKLRYLVESYDEAFWQESLYNNWLQSLRELNPAAQSENAPLFMQSTAWHQEKINTQLASWAQLRHDTLLYAKPSYTGGIACSYPHSYIEPYPEFYRRISEFASRAGTFFSSIANGDQEILWIVKFYDESVMPVMEKLAVIAEKELAESSFSEEDCLFLSEMLFTRDGYGGKIFTGWYPKLYYSSLFLREADYLVADVHTQPTDEVGNIVGKVLHVGVGPVNLGVFIADSPSNDFMPMAYIGPVMSYYEHMTGGFERLTDEGWFAMFGTDSPPARPDWVNSYLADSDGNARPAGRELPGIPYGDVFVEESETTPAEYPLVSAYPNPFNPSTTIRFTVPGVSKVEVTVFDLLGRKIATLADETMQAGVHSIVWNATGMPSGVYFCRVRAGDRERTAKMLLMK